MAWHLIYFMFSALARFAMNTDSICFSVQFERKKIDLTFLCTRMQMSRTALVTNLDCKQQQQPQIYGLLQCFPSFCQVCVYDFIVKWFAVCTRRCWIQMKFLLKSTPMRSYTVRYLVEPNGRCDFITNKYQK